MKTLHHLLLTSLALGLLTGRAGAEIFPVFEDAAGSVKANTITKAGGTAKTLAISKTSNAYLNFLVSSAEMNSVFISAARLVIFLPKTTPKGVISIHALTSEWTETLTTPKITAPALGTLIDEIDLEDIPLKADYYIADVTNLVKFWMNNPEEEFGLALVSDGVANVTLASKEGFTSGHPAFIEIDYNQARSESNTYISAESTTDSLAGYFATNSLSDYYMGIGLNASDWMLFDNVAEETRILLNSSGQIGMGGPPAFGRLTLQGIDLGGNVSGILDMKDLEGVVQWHTTLENGGLNFVEANASDERFFLQAGGNVGIGTRFPASQLHVKQTDPGSTLLLQGGDAEGENPPARAGLAFSYFDSPIAKHFITTNHSTSTPANNKMGFWLNNRVGTSTNDAPGDGTTQVMTLTGQGRVGIGAVNPGFKLDVNGDLRCFGFTNSSDARYKRDLRPLTGALGKVRALRARSYDWDHAAFPDKDLPKRRSIGFIAQELREVLPELVTEDAEGYLSIAYTEVIPVLTQAIQELHTQVSTRESEITRLKARLAQLEAREEKRDTQLAAIHALLRSSGKAQALPAALKKDTDAE